MTSHIMTFSTNKVLRGIRGILAEDVKSTARDLFRKDRTLHHQHTEGMRHAAGDQ
jgi:hypothetical protein